MKFHPILAVIGFATLCEGTGRPQASVSVSVSPAIVESNLKRATQLIQESEKRPELKENLHEDAGSQVRSRLSLNNQRVQILEATRKARETSAEYALKEAVWMEAATCAAITSTVRDVQAALASMECTLLSGTPAAHERDRLEAELASARQNRDRLLAWAGGHYDSPKTKTLARLDKNIQRLENLSNVVENALLDFRFARPDWWDNEYFFTSADFWFHKDSEFGCSRSWREEVAQAIQDKKPFAKVAQDYRDSSSRESFQAAAQCLKEEEAKLEEGMKELEALQKSNGNPDLDAFAKTVAEATMRREVEVLIGRWVRTHLSAAGEDEGIHLKQTINRVAERWRELARDRNKVESTRDALHDLALWYKLVHCTL